MKRVYKALGLLTPLIAAAAATPTAHGTFEVIALNPELRIVGVLAILASVTALTYILILLACGMRNPVL